MLISIVDIDAPHITVRWISWNRPSLNQVVALNTDGSVSTNNAEFGGLLRHHDGSWIMGYYGSLGNIDILGAELLTGLEGLNICWERDFRNVICLTDSSLAVQAITKGVSHFHKHATIVKAIQDLLKRDWMICVQHTLREGNHYLAKHGAASAVVSLAKLWSL
ncbi:Ribonuclease H domain [Sesbania bispinosa]|nr:Ribonuclease H domain [Sesbania bispinosa]